jgi:hypothetical protein
VNRVCVCGPSAANDVVWGKNRIYRVPKRRHFEIVRSAPDENHIFTNYRPTINLGKKFIPIFEFLNTR